MANVSNDFYSQTIRLLEDAKLKEAEGAATEALKSDSLTADQRAALLMAKARIALQLEKRFAYSKEVEKGWNVAAQAVEEGYPLAKDPVVKKGLARSDLSVQNHLFSHLPPHLQSSGFKEILDAQKKHDAIRLTRDQELSLDTFSGIAEILDRMKQGG